MSAMTSTECQRHTEQRAYQQGLHCTSAHYELQWTQSTYAIATRQECNSAKKGKYEERNSAIGVVQECRSAPHDWVARQVVKNKRIQCTEQLPHWWEKEEDRWQKTTMSNLRILLHRLSLTALLYHCVLRVDPYQKTLSSRWHHLSHCLSQLVRTDQF